MNGFYNRGVNAFARFGKRVRLCVNAEVYYEHSPDQVQLFAVGLCRLSKRCQSNVHDAALGLCLIHLLLHPPENPLLLLPFGSCTVLFVYIYINIMFIFLPLCLIVFVHGNIKG